MFDLIGVSPQLLIFNDIRYKSIFSTLTTLLILLFSIIFAIFSLNEYFKYESPILIYSKGFDENITRAINIKEILLMFQLMDASTYMTIDDSVAYYVGELSINYDNGTNEIFNLDIQPCEFEKNIDAEFKDFVRDKSKFGKSFEDFYCINSQNQNKSLFYRPNIGSSNINLYVYLKNNSNYIPEQIQSLIVSENDFLDHNNKEKPIKRNYIYHLTTGYSSSEYTTINYNFQYIKYESDDGFFYKNEKSFIGISFSDMTFYKNINNKYNLNQNFKTSNISNIAKISFEINKTNYEDYKRTYSRLQSLLAEVMSVVNLLFEIGRLVSYILCNKKMSKDIVGNLLNKANKINEFNKKNNKRNINFKGFEISSSSEKIKIKQESEKKIYNSDNSQNKSEKLNISKDNNILKIKKLNKININNIILTKINFCNILKSFLCFKDKKTKLINLCHNIITEDLSIERILERFYNLENIYYFISNEEKETLNIIKNKRLTEIDKYIDNINKDIIINNNNKSKIDTENY